MLLDEPPDVRDEAPLLTALTFEAGSASIGAAVRTRGDERGVGVGFAALLSCAAGCGCELVAAGLSWEVSGCS
jgi:hypothetical protein